VAAQAKKVNTDKTLGARPRKRRERGLPTRGKKKVKKGSGAVVRERARKFPGNPLTGKKENKTTKGRRT